MNNEHNFIRPPRSLEDASPVERDLLNRAGINPDGDQGILAAFRVEFEAGSGVLAASYDGFDE
jgi:hypothetical protein